MNGDTNGTMGDPLDMSMPSSPIGSEAKKTFSDPDIHLKLSEKTITDNGHDATLTGIMYDERTSEISNKESDPELPPLEITACQKEDNNNSNELCPNTVQSLQKKPESKEKNDTVKLFEDKDKNVKLKVLDEEDTQDTLKDSDELDSEDSSSDSEGGFEGSELKAVDTVSIHSDSEHDLLTDDDDFNKQSDIIFVDSNMPEKQNGTKNCGSPSEVHEIDSDNEDEDCVVTSEEVKPKHNVKIMKVQTNLRRSSRTVKKKSLSKGDDDVQLVGVDNSKVRNKSKSTLFMNHVKSFIQRASRSNKVSDRTKRAAKIHEKTLKLGKKRNPINVEELYQSIAARGTTVTPVNKLTAAVAATMTVTSTSTSTAPAIASATTAATATAPVTAPATVTTQVTPPQVLPSLTDDMFVVEAPSFVVPYVYEKPSVKAFRQFVDSLGKQLEEERAKEAQESQEKAKESTEGPDKLKPEKLGPVVQSTDDKANNRGKVKQKSRRRSRHEDDDSWDGSDETSDSDDDVITDEDKNVVIKDVDDVEITKVVLANTAKAAPAKPDTYFDCSLGKFFMEIGLNQVQEYVQNDLLKLQNRKLSKEKKSGKRTKATEVAISLLTKNIELSRSQNEQFTYKQKKCEFCSFQTESMLVMSNHFETPHMKNGLYKCNFCAAELRTPHDIMQHMDLMHKMKCKLEKAPGNHQCVNCLFEDNAKGKLARHLISCAKRFKPETNLSPPIDWEPPAKIPKIVKSRGNMVGGAAVGFKGPQMNNNVLRPPMNLSVVPGGMMNAFRQRMQHPPAPPLLQRSNIIVRQLGPPSTSQVVQQLQNRILAGSKPANQQPSISITPLPRAPHHSPSVPAPPAPPTKGTFVICEICDGYIKDLEQLRNHMQWIHKVKIHPKMIYNRPPLNCQKCQFRFFTDQGLERHLLGTHGLVTSSMQEAANKGKDAGRCPVCGRVYQWKLLHHVAKDHNLTLKPAHLSYKCTVCTATFGMYKQFESHVYSAHRVVAKRALDKNAPVKASGHPQPKPPENK